MVGMMRDGTTAASGGAANKTIWGTSVPAPPTRPNVRAAATTKAPIRAAAPRAAAPRASAPVYGGGGGGGGAPAISAPPAPISNEDYLASGADSSYQAQIAALAKALENQMADLTAQQGKYEVDYGSTLKNLGWTQDNPATPDVNEGAWNFGDLNTAAGRSFQNQQDDFAGRGLLESSLYGTANDNLTRSLNDQLGGINTGRTNFLGDLSRQRTAFQGDNSASVQQARADAIQRRAAQAAMI